MSIRTLIASLLALTCALAPRGAAQDEKAFLAAYKKEVKSTLKFYKATLAEAAADLDAELEVFEQHFDDLPFDDTPIEDLVTALNTYKEDVSSLGGLVASTFGFVAGDGLQDLSLGGADDNVFPVGMLCGDGGVLDDALAGAETIARKATAAVNKKLDKLEKKLRKTLDLRLNVVLAPDPGYSVVPTSGSFDAAHKALMAVDLLVAFNRGGEDDDGRLWVCGFTDLITPPDIVLSIVGPITVNASFPASNQRWMYATDRQADPLPEGNYLINTAHGNGMVVTNSIGLP